MEDSLCVSRRESNVCSSLYASRYWVLCWDTGQIFKQSMNRSLESSQTGHAVFTENKELHSHIGDRISWRSLDILILILLNAKTVEDPRQAISTC